MGLSASTDFERQNSLSTTNNKALAVALCLFMTKVAAEVEGTTTEEGAQETVQNSKDFVQDFMDQLLAPPFENGSQFHLYLGIAVALIASLLYLLCAGQQEDFDQQITMGDLKKEGKATGKLDDDERREIFFKDLDKYGPYEREINGTLTLDALRRLRDVINVHAYKLFMPRKEQLMNERCEIFKKKDWK